MMSDLHDNILVTRALAPVAASTNDTAAVSEVLDLGTVNSTKVEFIGVLGTDADTDVTFTVLVEDSPDNSNFTAVDDAFLLGVEAMGLRYDSDNKTFKIGYIGMKRYLRVTVTPANNTGNFFIAAVWVQAGLRKAPKSTQVN